MKRTAFFLPITFFLLTFILLVLPGNELPKSELFFKGFDKVVHTLLFFTLTFLFCRPFKSLAENNAAKTNWFVRITIAAIIYGAAMEFVQLYFVPFRSFELADILFDSLGAVMALVYCIKKFLVTEVKK